MTRDEALRLLGLDEDATEADIKLAYKEIAQILHPDKYADNKRLADRATEQFKLINEAYQYLAGKKGSSRKGSGGGKSRSSGASYGASDRAAELMARLAGITAARTQLSAQLDAENDRRKIGIYLTAGGAIGMILGEFFAMRIIMPFGGTALIWGVIQLFNAQSNIKMIRQHLEKLDKDRKKYEKELKKL